MDFPLDLSIPQLTHEEDHGHRSLRSGRPGDLAFRVKAMGRGVVGASWQALDGVEVLVFAYGLGAA